MIYCEGDLACGVFHNEKIVHSYFRHQSASPRMKNPRKRPVLISRLAILNWLWEIMMKLVHPHHKHFRWEETQNYSKQHNTSTSLKKQNFSNFFMPMGHSLSLFHQAKQMPFDFFYINFSYFHSAKKQSKQLKKITIKKKISSQILRTKKKSSTGSVFFPSRQQICDTMW